MVLDKNEIKKYVGKSIGIFVDAGEGKVFNYKGRILSFDSLFVVLFDYMTSKEIAIPLDRIIRIEFEKEVGSNPK